MIQQLLVFHITLSTTPYKIGRKVLYTVASRRVDGGHALILKLDSKSCLYQRGLCTKRILKVVFKDLFSFDLTALNRLLKAITKVQQDTNS